jgi:hypothetical protein
LTRLAVIDESVLQMKLEQASRVEMLATAVAPWALDRH